MDKTKAMIEYLLTCPSIAQSPLYFNFINADNDDKQLVTVANDRTVNTTYIDGSVQKRFQFTLIDYRSVAYQELAKLHIDSNENVEEFLDIQGIVDWIEDQNKLKLFPNFGEDCLIDSITTMTDNPSLNGVDTNSKPALAKYSITIQVDYIDVSDKLWNE